MGRAPKIAVGVRKVELPPVVEADSNGAVVVAQCGQVRRVTRLSHEAAQFGHKRIELLGLSDVAGVSVVREAQGQLTDILGHSAQIC